MIYLKIIFSLLILIKSFISQILQAANKNKDIAEFSLVFANRSSADILLKNELEEFTREKKINLKVFFTIDNAEENWIGGVGFLNKDMIVPNLPTASDDTIILMCGPPVMCQKILMPILQELGHKKEDIFEFQIFIISIKQNFEIFYYTGD